MKEFIKKKEFIWVVLLSLAIIIAVIGAIASSKPKTTEKTDEHVGYVEGKDYSDSKITTYSLAHEVLHGDSITEAVSNMRSVVDYIKTTNAYVRVQVGEEDYDYYVYNTKGECLAQSYDGSTCLVFRANDNPVIAFGGDTGNVMLSNETDVISLIDNIISVAESDTEDKDGITVFDMVLDSKEEKFHEYRIEVVGEDNFKKIYENIAPEMGDTILETLRSQIAQVSENEFIPHLIYTIMCNTEDNSLVAICELIVDGVEHSNWIVDGYLTLDDWQLSEDWYSEDFTALTSEESFGKLEILLDNIQALIDKYANENNIDSSESSDNLEENSADSLDGLDETVADSSDE